MSPTSRWFDSMRSRCWVCQWNVTAVSVRRIVDRLFASVANIDVTYPPYDLVKVTDNHYRIVIAVAGFTRDELEIEVEKQKLTVSGKKTEETTKETAKNWLHRGIATRAFSRTFILGDYTRISGAKFDNGLLTIEAIQEIPENLAAKKIEIQ